MSDRDDDATADSDPKRPAPNANRFTRFRKLSTLTAGVAARHFTQRVMSTFQSEEDAEAQRKRSQAKSATEMAKTLGELKGAAMKIGQMLATDPELIPEEMVETLSQLQHSAPPMYLSVVRDVVEQALGGRIEDHFSSFSDTAIGAASIGQVHRATTKDGQDVAVKIQYPGIAATIRSDIKNLGSMLNLARASGLPKERVDQYLDEVTEVLERESDYLREAENLERFIVLMKNVEGIRVPAPVHELTRVNVLTMEFCEGVRLFEWLEAAPLEARSKQGYRLLSAYLEMMHVHGVLHADPHPGNFLVDPQGNIVILDLGCVREYSMQFCDDLVAMLAALWRHDVDQLQAAWRRLKFIDDGVDPEVAYEWLCIILEPLLVNRDFDFGTWKVKEKMLAFLLENPGVKRWAPPRQLIFYARVMAGMRGLLQKTGIKLNLHAISKRVATERGLWP